MERYDVKMIILQNMILEHSVWSKLKNFSHFVLLSHRRLSNLKISTGKPIVWLWKVAGAMKVACELTHHDEFTGECNLKIEYYAMWHIKLNRNIQELMQNIDY